jgi:hypothetical protein
MTAPHFVSFFAGPGYACEADGLRASLDALALPYTIEERTDAGSWLANCAQKPVFLKEMRQRIRGPIVWLDADARVLKAPDFFAELPHYVDVAYHLFRGRELLSGTLYFGDTSGARRLLDAWVHAQVEQLTAWDQRVLEVVLSAWPGVWVAKELPEAYVYVDRLGTKGIDPVIYHGQASRRLKARAE